MSDQHSEIEILIERIQNGDRFALSKGITMIESKRPEHRESAIRLLEHAVGQKSQSVRIAISGAPGVGKSTFIESFGLYLIHQGKQVAILAIDPSSQISKGSILGDKTRMEKLSNEPLAFIRPSAAGETVGGVAHRTKETIQLCEAAGYDVILVETVGVGQSEYKVSNMVDFFMLILQPGGGDALQGIKRGIVEMADLIIVNKSDGERVKMAEQTRIQFKNALQLFPVGESGWSPKIVLSSALESTGIDTCWKIVEDYISQIGYATIEKTRIDQNLLWVKEQVRDWIQHHVLENQLIQNTMNEVFQQVKNEQITVSKGIQIVQEKIKSFIYGDV